MQFTENTILEKGRSRAVVDSDDGKVIKAQRLEVTDSGMIIKDPFEVPEDERNLWAPVGRIAGKRK